MKRNLERFLRIRPVRFVADIIRIYFKEHVSRSAAQLAYFLIMTFFPILICIAAFLGRVNLHLSDMLAGLEHLLPQGVFTIFQEYLGYLDTNFSTAMLITGIFLTVLFASAAIRGLTSFLISLSIALPNCFKKPCAVASTVVKDNSRENTRINSLLIVIIFY